MEIKEKQALDNISEGLKLILKGICIWGGEERNISKCQNEETIIGEENITMLVTKDKLKEMMIEKSRLGKEKEIRQILQEQGVVRLSDLDEEFYSKVYQQVLDL